MSGVEVRKRCVFFLGGYEPIPPARQHERFQRELRRFEEAWKANATVSELSVSDTDAVAQWHVTARGPNWAVDTDYRSLLWADLVEADFGRSNWVRVPKGIGAFADFIFSGTALRYFVVNWRYGLFFLYPVLILLACAGAAGMAGWSLAGLGLPVWLSPLAAFAVFALLILFAGRYLMLAYMLDDWIFARELVHRSRPGLDARLDHFAQAIADEMRAGRYDEILFSGHSLGCAMKLDVIDRALTLCAKAGGPAAPLKVMSTGSSLLKIALHPAAGWLKAAVARVSAAADIFWVDYQSMVDVISFYKVDPVRALKLPETGRPLVRRVHLRDMLERATYRRFRGNFFRLHRQLVMGNDRRYFYDYFMICCGPFRFETRVQHPERMVAAFAPDGSLVPQPMENERLVAQ